MHCADVPAAAALVCPALGLAHWKIPWEWKRACVCGEPSTCRSAYSCKGLLCRSEALVGSLVNIGKLVLALKGRYGPLFAYTGCYASSPKWQHVSYELNLWKMIRERVTASLSFFAYKQNSLFHLSPLLGHHFQLIQGPCSRRWYYRDHSTTKTLTIQTSILGFCQ